MSGVPDDGEFCLFEACRVEVDAPPEQREIPSVPAGDQHLNLWRRNGHGIPVDAQERARSAVRDQLTTLYPEPGTLGNVYFRAEPGEFLTFVGFEQNPRRSSDFGD